MLLSVSGFANLGGADFDDDDIFEYYPATDVGSIYLDGNTFFHQNEDINALHMLDNGHIVLSTADNGRIPPLNFGNDDLVEYDPVSGSAAIYFSGSLFAQGNENIDAVAVLPNGHVVLSTTGSARIGSIDFDDGDLAEYDPSSGGVSILFNESRFDGNEDIDAVHILDNGVIVLSTFDDAAIDGFAFTGADLVAYDPAGDTAWMYFRGSSFFEHTGENCDALFIGENVPAGHEHLIAVRSSVAPGYPWACNRLYFNIENYTGADIEVSDLTLTWSAPTAYFEEIEWDGETVYSASGTRPGSGDNVVFSSSKTIGNNTAAVVHINNFRSSPSGGFPILMHYTTFTVQFTDGSVFQITTGGCL